VITVTEIMPGGSDITVSGIAVAPPARLSGTPNLAGGSVNVTIGSGVTEVTFTNRKPTGYLEICKRTVSTMPPLVGPSSVFYVNPGNLGPFTVPSGSCSSAIEVAAGLVRIREAPVADSYLLSCSAIPAANQNACNIGGGISTVVVAPGDVSTQTIAVFTNHLEIIAEPATGSDPHLP
jgi:hypothetical protein